MFSLEICEDASNFLPFWKNYNNSAIGSVLHKKKYLDVPLLLATLRYYLLSHGRVDIKGLVVVRWSKLDHNFVFFQFISFLLLNFNFAVKFSYKGVQSFCFLLLIMITASYSLVKHDITTPSILLLVYRHTVIVYNINII